LNAHIEVNPSLAPATFPVRLLNEMGSHALETHPEECCGLLVGGAPGRFEAVHRCHNDMTRLHLKDPEGYPRDGRRAFHMNEAEYLRIQQQAETEGRGVTAIYHSHVDAGAHFSRMDQDFARQPLFPFPDAWHIVISLVDRRVKEIAAYVWNEERNAFEGRPVQAVAP